MENHFSEAKLMPNRTGRNEAKSMAFRDESTLAASNLDFFGPYLEDAVKSNIDQISTTDARLNAVKVAKQPKKDEVGKQRHMRVRVYYKKDLNFAAMSQYVNLINQKVSGGVADFNEKFGGKAENYDHSTLKTIVSCVPVKRVEGKRFLEIHYKLETGDPAVQAAPKPQAFVVHKKVTESALFNEALENRLK